MKKPGRNLLPRRWRRWLVRITRRPPVGRVRSEDLRRLAPISRSWGGDRGRPIDRYYIERFLGDHQADIRGRVLEVGDNAYTKAFGGMAVTRSDVLHIEAGHPHVTIVADLTDAPQLDDELFDCIICTQTLQFIPDMGAAVATLERLLKPGGVLLVTGATASPLGMAEAERWGDFWRMTTYGLRWLLERRFEAERVTVRGYGNVFAAVAFMHGLATEELEPHELEHVDPQYELLAAGRAVKGERRA